MSWESEYRCADTFEVLPALPDKTFDFIHTDPPYGKPNDGYGKTKDVGQVATRERRYIANDQDLWWLLQYDVANQLYRVLKDDKFCVVWTMWEKAHTIETVFKMAGFDVVTQGIWNKEIQGQGGDFCNTYEIWSVFKKGNARTIHKMNKNVISFARLNGVRPDHPHSKPKEVVKKLLTMMSNRGDLILDSFAGTGSTAISCLELDRRYYCLELEQTHVDKALAKIKAYHANQLLEFKEREAEMS